MKFVFRAAAALSVVPLASCGGGGDGSPAAGPIATPAPQPPPPSPAYRSARDFSADRSESGFASRVERFRPYGAGNPPWRDVAVETTDVFGEVGFTYRANPKSYLAFHGREQRSFERVTTFEQTPQLVGDQDYRLSDPLPLHRYFRLVEQFSLLGPDRLAYVGYAGWSSFEANYRLDGLEGDREIVRVHLYGQTTVPSDLPTSGEASYDLGRFDFAVTEEVTFTVDWATGAITGRGRVRCPNGETCPGGDLGELTLTGSFNGSLRFTGTVAGSSGYTGRFAGSFYGPRAAEIGVVGELRHPSRRAEGFLDTGARLP